MSLSIGYCRGRRRIPSLPGRDAAGDRSPAIQSADRSAHSKMLPPTTGGSFASLMVQKPTPAESRSPLFQLQYYLAIGYR